MGLAVHTLSREAHAREDAAPHTPPHSPNSPEQAKNMVENVPPTKWQTNLASSFSTLKALAQVVGILNANGKRLLLALDKKNDLKLAKLKVYH